MTTWILLRGLTREARHWAALPDKLRASGIEGEVVLADLPGNGIHSRVRAPASVPEMVDFVSADVARLGYAPPYRVIAMSLGAMVAAAWAQRAPKDIECLALINTSMRPFSGPTERLRPSAWMELLCAAWRWRDRRDAEAAIHNLTCNRHDTRDADLAAWTEIYRSAPVSRANALRQLWAAARFQAAPHAPRCPTLVLSSREDQLVDPACSKKLAAAWQATHVEHPWAGHDLPHDDPAWVSDTVAAWGATSFERPLSTQR
ncbi:alpha/beta fold hydrolase [Trinickia mobilis]|uniref:alpha/beta fold hydrolase n=1 Tax=Trinickia mobilis TaxID=2816356 RepID=UPI001A8C1302|nr:alpha/beta hydrolase [Trinickia mobilis]